MLSANEKAENDSSCNNDPVDSVSSASDMLVMTGMVIGGKVSSNSATDGCTSFVALCIIMIFDAERISKNGDGFYQDDEKVMKEIRRFVRRGNGSMKTSVEEESKGIKEKN